MLGYSAGNITTGDGNVSIGKADLPSATGDNQLSISSGDGSVIWITGGVGNVTSDASTFDAPEVKIGPTTAQFSGSKALGNIRTTATVFLKLKKANIGAVEISYNVFDDNSDPGIPVQYQTEKILLQTDGSGVDFTTYGTIYTTDAFGTISAAINGTDIEIKIEGTGATNASNDLTIQYHGITFPFLS